MGTYHQRRKSCVRSGGTLSIKGKVEGAQNPKKVGGHPPVPPGFAPLLTTYKLILNNIYTAEMCVKKSLHFASRRALRPPHGPYHIIWNNISDNKITVVALKNNK